MLACNKNEIAIEAPAEAGLVHFTATIPAPGNSPATRTSYTEDAGTIHVVWKAGDEIALCHNSTKDVITLTASDINANGSVTISASITASDGEDVTVVYPAAQVSSVSGATPITSAPNYQAQDGTLDYIAANLDMRQGTGKIAVSGDKASFQSGITMDDSKLAVWKLSLTDGSAALDATQVTLSKGDCTIATATGTAKSVYYMALPPQLLTAYGGDFTIAATVGSYTYIYSRSSLTLEAGKYYQSTVTMTEMPGHLLSVSAVGEIVGTDGKAYDLADKDNLPSGITAAGVVAYKSGTNGLVISLNAFATTSNWTNANSNAASYTPAVSGRTWKLPSMDEWKNMLSGNDTDGWSSSSLNAAILAAGGTALGADSQYWTSTQKGEYPIYYYVDFTNNTGTFYSKMGSGDAYARACIAF